MSTVRKMQLISEAELNRLRAKQIREYDPDITAIVRLETEIENILNDTTKNETEKIAELRSAQIKSRNLRDQEAVNLKNPLATIRPVAHQAATAAAAAAATTAAVPGAAAAVTEEGVQRTRTIDAADEEHMLRGLRGATRQKAEQVLGEIKKHPESIQFDKHSRHLLINNEPIEGSNFIDIFAYAFASSVKNKSKPPGLLSFYSALNKLNVPQSYLARRNAYSNLRNPPPGIGSNILRVYPI